MSDKAMTDEIAEKVAGQLPRPLLRLPDLNVSLFNGLFSLSITTPDPVQRMEIVMGEGIEYVDMDCDE